jgi:hypothetical protein
MALPEDNTARRFQRAARGPSYRSLVRLALECDDAQATRRAHPPALGAPAPAPPTQTARSRNGSIATGPGMIAPRSIALRHGHRL